MSQSLKKTFSQRLSIIILLSAALISAGLILTERSLLKGDLQERGATIARILSNVTLDALVSHDYATMQRYVGEIADDESIRSIAVLRQDGRLLAGEPPGSGPGILLAEHPIRLGDEELGLIRIGFSTDRLDAITWWIIGATVLLVVALHLFGLLFTDMVLRRTVLVPLAALQDAIKTVADGNLQPRIKERGPREFDEIASTFNEMAYKLQSSFEVIAEHQIRLDLEKQKLAAVVGCMADGLFVTDNEGTITIFNTSAAEITGYAEAEALGGSCSELFRSSLCHDACALLHDDESRHNIETYLLTKAGKSLTVAVSSAILRDNTGQRVGGVQTFRDISAEKRRHELYCRAEKLAATGQLAAGVAHEINTPLGNIIGYAGMIKADSEPAAIARRVAVIIEQARKCSEIVRGLLDYSRSSATTMAPVDLNTVAQRVAKVLQLQLDKKELALELNTGDIAVFTADERKVEQVVMNLVLNAIQAVEPGGRIELQTWCTDKRVLLAVRDSGPGVSAELQSRIFDPFFTTKPVGEGTGLGLAICAGIIAELGGSIDLESDSAGSTFMVNIPIKAEGDDDE
ncbi:MAG: ATP-binding protein [Desulfurivibrio sp.]|nr:ATP-binding protein [Desulfurivibrio sp.]